MQGLAMRLKLVARSTCPTVSVIRLLRGLLADLAHVLGYDVKVDRFALRFSCADPCAALPPTRRVCTWSAAGYGTLMCGLECMLDQNLTVGTIKSHVGAILGKLEWSSRTQAVIVAARRGLVQRGLDSFELA
jgi:hypothetical protein